MGKFQPSIGGRVPPRKMREESSCDDVRYNTSRWAMPGWVWIAVSAFVGLGLLLLVVSYLTGGFAYNLVNKVMGATEIRHQTWWYWPAFRGLVVLILLRLLFLQWSNSTGAHADNTADADMENTSQLKQLLRILTIVTVGLMLVLVCAHSNLSGWLRVTAVRMTSIHFAWWVPPFAITLIIALLVAIWMTQRYREYNEVALLPIDFLKNIPAFRVL